MRTELDLNAIAADAAIVGLRQEAAEQAIKRLGAATDDAARAVLLAKALRVVGQLHEAAGVRLERAGRDMNEDPSSAVVSALFIARTLHAILGTALAAAASGAHPEPPPGFPL